MSALMFLDMHFIGVKHYYPTFYREYLPIRIAAREALLWGFMGPVLWLFQEYVFPDSDFWGLEWQVQRLIVGGAIVAVLATVAAWRWMLPLWGLAAAVALYLRVSRPRDSL